MLAIDGICVKMLLVSNKDDFAKWLRDELASRGMSQADLAREANIHRAIISKAYNGTSLPSPETCRAIARALKMPAEEVLRAAGELPEMDARDEQIERIRHKMRELSGEDRARLEAIVDGFLTLKRGKEHGTPPRGGAA